MSFLTNNFFIQFFKVKSVKIYSVIKEWKFYNRFCNFSSSKFSLFFLKKKIFKAFLSESNQDVYSTKILLDKCFSSNVNNLNFFSFSSPYYSHISFCRFIRINKNVFLKNICIYCGINTSFFN